MKNSKPSTPLIIFAVLGVAAIFLLMAPRQQPASVFVPVVGQSAPNTRLIRVGGQQVHVSVVDSDASREKGLGGRDGLAPNEGMLFVFGNDGHYSFWMKDMKFAIDILWLTSEGKVVYVQSSLLPSTFPSSFGPGDNARYVLELPAGFAQNHGILVGDLVQL